MLPRAFAAHSPHAISNTGSFCHTHHTAPPDQIQETPNILHSRLAHVTPLNSGARFIARVLRSSFLSPQNHTNTTWQTRPCLLAPITALILAGTATSQNFSALVRYARSNLEQRGHVHLPCHTLSCVPARAFRIGLAKSDPASSAQNKPTCHNNTLATPLRLHFLKHLLLTPLIPFQILVLSATHITRPLVSPPG